MTADSTEKPHTFFCPLPCSLRVEKFTFTLKKEASVFRQTLVTVYMTSHPRRRYYFVKVNTRKCQERVSMLLRNVGKHIPVFFPVALRAKAGAIAFSFLRFLDHRRHSTAGRTPLGQWSAGRRGLYLATHNAHKTDINVPRWDSKRLSPQASGRRPTP